MGNCCRHCSINAYFSATPVQNTLLLFLKLSISEGASRLSLPEGTLGQWVTAARKGLGTPGSRTVAELESEILQLRKALNEARLERDILKKATAYFAQESLKNTR
ncbi:IS600 ORF1 [Shigella sonnei]|nr:IS600 ORF1 [Shigella sonnei]